MTQPNNSENRWIFEKRLGLDTVLAFLVLLGGLFGYAVTASGRQAKAETKIETLERGATDLKGEFRAQKDEFRQDLREINSKLDRLIEAQGRRK